MRRAEKGVKVKDVITAKFINRLIESLRTEINQQKPREYKIPHQKATAVTGDFPVFTPVAIEGQKRKLGTFRHPLVKANTLVPGPWGVVQDLCTTTKPADVVTHGTSWCKVTVTDVDHPYAKIESGDLVSTDNEDDAVADILHTDGDVSLIYFPRPGKGGGEPTTIVVARVLLDVDSTDATFTAKIKGTIAGTPQTFDEEITVENLDMGNTNTPVLTGDYTHANQQVFVLLAGMNIIVAKANTDTVSWPHASAPKCGWFILQAPGTLACEPEVESSDPPPP